MNENTLKQDEKLLKQIEDITKRKGLKLTDKLIRKIIYESNFVRDFGRPEAERVPEVIIEDISKAPLKYTDIIVNYSSQSGSLKKHIEGTLYHLMDQEFFRYAEKNVSFEEYFGEDRLNHFDKICEILEGVNDVAYEIQLRSGLSERGCNFADTTYPKIENAEKELMTNIVKQKGVYNAVLFLMLREDIENEGAVDGPLHRDRYKKIFDIIGEYTENDTISGVEQFLEELDSSGLSSKDIDYIQKHDFTKEFIDMLHQEEQIDIVPGHPKITMNDIRNALHGRDKGLEEDL